MPAGSRSVASRALAAAFAVVVAVVLGMAGCGRSGLDDYLLLDGGPTLDAHLDARNDAPLTGCNATTCPTGCCDPAGTCQTGTAVATCGTGGEACQNCQAEGFALCDPTRHACGNPVTNCTPADCGGCCDGTTCFAGSSVTECGFGGQFCAHCQQEGLVCAGGACVQPACGPGTCSGCCFGDECIPGTQSTACGAQGQQCVNCAASGQSCVLTPGGGACEGTPTCGPQNCAGCCLGNACLSGSDSTACGFGGQQCTDCATFGASCEGQSCVNNQFCNPQNCPGCCEGNVCVPGFDSAACGFGGQQCQDCVAFAETCNGGVCSSQSCGPQNCPGCCEGDTCVPGFDPGECGFGGQQCQDCIAFGESCNGGFCSGQTTCGPENCPGCCVGNQCVVGNTDTQCGFGGSTCQDCVPFSETCNGGVCTGQTTCSPGTCQGCCEGNACVSGTSQFACGIGGLACQTCNGGQTCTNQQCVSGSTCGPDNCTGCCVGNFCLPGNQNFACGAGGGTCEVCISFGDTCQNSACVGATACSPQNCPGCCTSTGCVGGTSDTQCGAAGGQCQDCTAQGETCQNEACAPLVTCGPQNCPGCCEGNTCMFGGDPAACGFGGLQCQDCSAFGQTCTNGTCQSSCNQFNCAGCCDANQQCQPGFLDAQCGGQGNACVNCTTLNPPSTCDGSVSPAACKGQETTCPSTYGGCTAPPTQPPFPQAVCSNNDLSNAAAACASDPYTTECFNFFNVEFQTNSACASCLQPFDYEFADGEGVYACVAPYVSAACDAATACAFDCESQSCGTCTDTPTYQACRNTVDGPTGQCAKYQAGASCDASALSGPAAFCNPSGYASYGAWLQAVGSHYCGLQNVDAGPPPFDGGFFFDAFAGP